MREIMTVQVGSFANFIGSHFWNFQDELIGLAADPNSDAIFKNQNRYLNMDVIYRTGETRQGSFAYTPRLVSIDYQGSLGSVSSNSSLYNDAEDSSVSKSAVTWTGKVSTLASEQHKQNLFLQCFSDQDIINCLGRSVQFWTDFSKVNYHQQSLHELSGILMGSQDINDYGTGRDIFSHGSQGDEINERLRFFIEECDNIQGFQFIVDDSGCFSAFAAELLENIADEYRSAPVLLYSLKSCAFKTKQSSIETISRNILDAIGISTLSDLSNLTVPIGLPLLSKCKASSFLYIEDEKPYQSSAVYAAALHSISLSFRSESHGRNTDSFTSSNVVDMDWILKMLTRQGRLNTVSILDVAMPPSALPGKEVEHTFLENLQPLTPDVIDGGDDKLSVECTTIHGVFGPGGMHRASVSQVEDTINAAYSKSQASTRPFFSHLSSSPCPLPIPLPFPNIFGDRIGMHGELVSIPTQGPFPKGSLRVHSIPIASRLRSSNAVLPFLEKRLRNFQKYGTERGSAGNDIVRSWGFSKEELQGIEETLYKMIQNLEGSAPFSSDSE